jgi:hypothetical protein
MPSRRRLGTLVSKLNQPLHPSAYPMRSQGLSPRTEAPTHNESLIRCQPKLNNREGLSDGITVDTFHFQAIERAPRGAIFRPAATICWIYIECGLWTELRGVSEFCELGSGVTIAVIPTEAKFYSLDGENCVCIQAGIWRISRRD